MSSNIIGPSPKYSVAPSDKLQKSSENLDDIEAPKDSVLKIMSVGKVVYVQVVTIHEKDLDNKN